MATSIESKDFIRETLSFKVKKEKPQEDGRVLYSSCVPWLCGLCVPRNPNKTAGKRSSATKKPEKTNAISKALKLAKINNGSSKKKTRFQYDPQSYARNFDDGIEKEADDHALVSFRARYANSGGRRNSSSLSPSFCSSTYGRF